MSTLSALVLITSSFPISGDGSEAAGAFVADVAEELGKTLPVRVVAPGHAASVEEWSEGVEVFRYWSPDKPLSTLKPWRPLDAWNTLRVMQGGSAATEAAMSRGSVRHILALWALPCGEWARSSAAKHGLRYSVWTLGSDIWSLGRIPLVRSCLRRILRDGERCWSDGLQLADDTRALSGRPVDFLPSTRRTHGARVATLKSRPPYRLVFLGRWHANKGVDLLLDALKRLSEEDWDRIEAVDICGGGPLDSLVRSGVEELRASGRPVFVHGFLNRTEAERVLLQADWLLIPSRIESIPVVFSDAMKLGCPVIAMPVGDLPRLVEEHPCGFVAGEISAAAYAEVLSLALSTSVREFAPGLAAQVQTFDLAAVARQITQTWGNGGHA